MTDTKQCAAKLEMFDLPVPTTTTKSPEEVERAYREAIKTHPFNDNAHSVMDVYNDAVFRDGEGNVVAVFIKGALPEYAATMAAEVLRPAATKTSLRSNIYGGEAPNSGIAGYFDYRGSPIEFKSRKTSFTYEHAEKWPDVFPMVDYMSSIYRQVMPEQWARQDAAIPDVVRIHGSPFSTLTINSRFRTASHTDAGDFDDGYGCLACLEGPFKGMCLTLDHFKVNFVMQPRDVILFDTHHFHSNTEPEALHSDWHRLTCVFYYRFLLGEPHSYAEYQRRLAAALKKGVTPPPVFTSIKEKDNGENHNKAAVTHPVRLSPFASAACIQSLRHCVAAATIIHQWLLAVGVAAEKRLFNEPLEVCDGIPDRTEDELECVHTANNTLAKHASPLGGFNENNAVIQAATENQKYLEDDTVSQYLSDQLFKMWITAKEMWLGLVKAEWEKMVARNPERKDFMWNNRSTMNAAFFDLCEVAKQVMLSILSKEIATAKEEQSFWALYAAHLNVATVKGLDMPEEAMSVKKLNVKLKDFNFGGTRYFKDMPEEEQQRRLERKRRIEEARRSGIPSVSERPPSTWLINDNFDYQTEDKPVYYAEEGRVDPSDNAKKVVPCPTALLRSQKLPDFDGVVSVLVVIPKPSAASLAAAAEANGRPPKMTKKEKRDADTAAEEARLLGNPAAAAMQSHGLVYDVLPPPVVEADGKIHIVYAYEDGIPEGGQYDFIILQHVLTCMDDDKARAFVSWMAHRARGFVVVEETDLQCRRYYRLRPSIRELYDAVAASCYEQLHSAKHGVSKAVLRTKAQLEALLPTCAARYKLQGSPLNTTLMIVPTELSRSS